MAKKLRQVAKNGVYAIRKMPKTPRVLPPDATFFIDSEVQLELLKRELERTAHPAPTSRTTTSETRVASSVLPPTMASLV
ncbi:hypothetical protein [Microbacterium xylanilyticum]